MINVKRIHHVAYRCNDAKETAEFYKKYLNMDLSLVFAEDRAPSTKEDNPYMHIFLDAGMGNVLAFFELPNSPQMGRDENTPQWVQHIAFEVESMEELNKVMEKVKSDRIDVIGPTDHTLFKSIYFFDPNGHRLELAVNTPIEKEKMEKLMSNAGEMLEEWSKTKRPPRQNAWLHQSEFAGVENE